MTLHVKRMTQLLSEPDIPVVTNTHPPQHRGEELSNDYRRRLAAVEPACLRTYTPTLAVLARSAGCYHWTPEGRMLADFTSGVLVANLGHNPRRWWQRVMEYMGLDVGDASNVPVDGKANAVHDTLQTCLTDASHFVQAAPLTAYNAVTALEVEASQRLIELLQRQRGNSKGPLGGARPLGRRR
jgi:acetylornithine/succinyldiaminopimelate/putrescine aminotransferase